MSQDQAIAPGVAGQSGRAARVRAAIAQAAQATGVDFRYLMAQAKLESGLDPQARAGTSSAAGLFQFTSGTWLTMLDRHGASHGLGWAENAIDGGRVSDPLLRQQILSLRHDPEASAMMAAELACDNGARLAEVLGRQPDSSELYLAHFLGSAGARKFLIGLSADPSQSAAALFPQEAAANRAIFYDASGARSLGEIMAWLRTRIAGTMAAIGDAPAGENGFALDPGFGPGLGSGLDSGLNEIAPAWPPAITATSDGDRAPYAAVWQQPAAGAPAPQPAAPQGPIAREFAAARHNATAAGRSMAETLLSTFGRGGGGPSDASAPRHVREAYTKLARFGL